MSAIDANAGAARTVSIVASGPLSTGLRDAIIADPALRLGAIAPRFTDLVVEPGFPGDVVVLDWIALVDMAPDGDRTVRRVLRLWIVN